MSIQCIQNSEMGDPINYPVMGPWWKVREWEGPTGGTNNGTVSPLPLLTVQLRTRKWVHIWQDWKHYLSKYRDGHHHQSLMSQLNGLDYVNPLSLFCAVQSNFPVKLHIFKLLRIFSNQVYFKHNFHHGGLLPSVFSYHSQS